MISVVIPLYNKEKQIAATLRSVFNQTFQDFEVVIVNDGSTDSSVSVVESLGDSRIRLINQKNSGVSAARNRGITEAKGEYIALLDADDEWKSDYLATQMSLAKQYPEASVFATNYEFRDASGEVTLTILRNIWFEGDSGILNNYFEVASLSHPPLWTSAIMVRKEAIEAIGGFPIGIKSGEDLLTWARLACRYKIAYCREPFAVFNVEGYEVSEQPKRIPAKNDYVADELVRLKKEFNPANINHYISHWHKMRSSVYMRLGMRKQSIKEALRGLRYHLANYKLVVYIAINLLPRKLQPF